MNTSHTQYTEMLGLVQAKEAKVMAFPIGASKEALKVPFRSRLREPEEYYSFEALDESCWNKLMALHNELVIPSRKSIDIRAFKAYIYGSIVKEKGGAGGYIELGASETITRVPEYITFSILTRDIQ